MEWLKVIGESDWTPMSLLALSMVMTYLLSVRHSKKEAKSNKEHSEAMLEMYGSATKQLANAINEAEDKIDESNRRITKDIKEVKDVLDSHVLHSEKNFVSKDFAEKHLVSKVDLADEVKKNMGK